MAEASGVTLALDAQTDEALSGGEDHALLAAFPADVALPNGFRQIGKVVAQGAHPVLVAGEPHNGRGGWDPYRDWDSARG
jgi:thiamine-monophosphate kinase